MAKFTLILLAAPLAAAAVAAPAAAEDDSQHRVVVRYDDLNLASVSGRDRLTTRVKTAVREVCGTRLAHGLNAERKARRCEAATMVDADVKLAGLLGGDGTALADRGQVIVAAP
ncbi:MAG: UrcA family protein [Sphingopyxis sp.]|uniref:UrcA family protein n=1 Tax=Sphingopyxis sp. TaxID=1908224 RepID=UPI003D80D4B5